jgi:hypothetical protein
VAVKVTGRAADTGGAGFTDRVVVVEVTTTTGSDAAVLPRKGDPEVGVKVALTLDVPTGREEVVKFALPVASTLTVPSSVPLPTNVTVPTGIGDPDAVPATVAVRVAGWPAGTGEGFTARVVVVGMVVGVTTTTGSGGDVLPKKGDPEVGL